MSIVYSKISSYIFLNTLIYICTYMYYITLYHTAPCVDLSHPSCVLHLRFRSKVKVLSFSSNQNRSMYVHIIIKAFTKNSLASHAVDLKLCQLVIVMMTELRKPKTKKTTLKFPA